MLGLYKSIYMHMYICIFLFLGELFVMDRCPRIPTVCKIDRQTVGCLIRLVTVWYSFFFFLVLEIFTVMQGIHMLDIWIRFSWVSISCTYREIKRVM